LKTIMNARALKILAATKLLPLLLVLPAVAQAQYNYTNSYGIWEYTPDTGPVTIEGYTGSGGSIVIPSTINGYPVTNIAADAFFEQMTLTSVTIPNSVTNIGEFALYGCSDLTNVTIGSSVISIGEAAFEACISLTNVTIPNSVSSIGDNAFEYCSGLTNITIGSSVASIGEDVFDQCTSLTSVTIPDSVTNIGQEAFFYCTSLTSVTIGSGVTSMGEDAFYYCTSLTSLTIRNGVTTIGGYAFQDCTALPTVIIPASVTNYLSDSFFACSSLYSAYFLGNAPPDDNSTFYFGDPTTVYYLPGTIGWGSTFGGVPTVELTTPLQIGGGSLGVRASGFGFTIKGTKTQTVVVEASTNLTNWQPIKTNTLAGTSTNFSDPQWTNYPGRYYRLSLP
jgi:BspA type Leucine rich repeat region (6 copies)